MSSRSRGRFSPGFCNLVVPLSDRGRRESRAPTAPAAPCAKGAKNAHGFDRYSQDIPAFPAQWFYGLLRALPGERPFLPPSPAGHFPAGLTPGSRRQDHTTSPYAVSVFVRAVCTALTPQRPSQPAPRSVTIARTSLMVARDGPVATSE